MEQIKLSRPSIVVPDLDSAVKDFEEVFSMTFHIVVNEELGVKLAFSDEGLNLVANLDPDNPSQLMSNWTGGVLAAIGFKVPDIDETRRRMKERGVQAIYDADAVRLRDSTYYKDNFHDLPVAIYEYEGESFVDAVGARSTGDYDVKLDWKET
jgi:predicted enzyme related to lactoylglutathione lyase